tara:strand:+ start:468 stop:2483 length:2016 start_codon:yes stop_codon:yes gene_type:complete
MNHFRLQPSFVNTREFSCEARSFLRNGYYTNSPPGTYAYKEYWDEQTRRCLEGFEVGGVRITGPHYFYLNFTQIKATVKQGKLERKILTFPSFLDMDYYYFDECELARNNGQGMIVAKARRKGFSYKNGALCVHQYNFFRDSTSIIGAYLNEYGNATMAMALEMINFINKHTAWAKRRNPDRRDFVKARFKEVKDGKEVWNGYNSEIFTLTFKDNFSAAIGKTADLMLWEEAGKFPNLINAYMITAPVFRDGNVMIGMPLIFGTGGDMDGGSNDFAEMFYNPDKYWLRPFENIWDDGGAGTNCGFFIDDMWYKPGKVTLSNGDVVKMVDDEGNSVRDAAEEFLDQERKIVKTTDSRTTWEKYITQSPKTPREAFLKSTGNIFPTIELNAWLGELEVTKLAKDMAMIGDLWWDKDQVKWMPNDNLNPINKFPIKNTDDRTGCVVIWEHPYRDEAGHIPYGLYIAGTDPYDQDDSTTSSLGSTFIYKTFQKFDNTYNIPVAEYTGRPDTAKEYYETVRKLLTYFNAQTLYENNLKGLKIYFEQKKSLHLLKEQPNILKDIVNRTTVSRGYGVHMSEPIKVQCELYLRDWLLEKRADGQGGDQLNLHTIYSIPLIQELIAYDHKEGNFDRAISFMLCVLHSHENYNVDLEGKYDFNMGDKFWSSSLFKKRKKSF